MPRATDELRAEWNDDTARECLHAAGYVLTYDWTWKVPTGHEPTEKEHRAMWYLVTEWDFGGFELEESS